MSLRLLALVAPLVLSTLATLSLTACMLDPSSSSSRTHFDFTALDSLPNPLSRWYDVPPDKSIVAVKFAFRTLDYARDADSNITAFAAASGGTPAVAGAYFDLNVTAVRLRAFLDAVHARGVVPFVTFDPKQYSNPNVTEQYAYIGQIPQGTWDDKLREVAGVLREFGHPVVFRFAHEMNGNWYPYAGSFSGGAADGPQEYVIAWRYVHALFNAEGATQLVWMFCPNAASYPNAAWNAPFAYYPGSAYVDWIAVDVYEHPDQKKQGLASLLDSFYDEMGRFFDQHAGDTAYALRPFGLGEFGTYRTNSTEKADWYVDALATLAMDERITFHALYNAQNGDKDFSIGGLGARLATPYGNAHFLFGPMTEKPQAMMAAKQNPGGGF